MDPLTQGVVGAALPQAIIKRPHSIAIGVCGFFAGLLPDLDVLIRSETDPLLYLEYHRQFSHSLVFIPIGGFLSALILFYALRRRLDMSFNHIWLYCTLGYGTHGILDAMTSYGTMLLWPFSDERFSFRIVSVVDPLFTLPLLGFVAFAVLRRKPLLARLGLVWCVMYLSLAVVQQNRAIEVAVNLASSRGHSPLRLEAKPSFGNILVWKTVYETKDTFFIDAVRVGVEPEVFEGGQIAKLDVERDFSWLKPKSQQARDIRRFEHFSDGYIALDPRYPDRIADVRYSMLPNEISPLWSIQLLRDVADDAHARFQEHRENPRQKLSELWLMVLGK